MSMPDQPQDDHCNEIHQVIMDLAEQFRSKIPHEHRERALDGLIWECVDGEDRPYSETLPDDIADKARNAASGLTDAVDALTHEVHVDLGELPWPRPEHETLAIAVENKGAEYRDALADLWHKADHVEKALRVALARRHELLELAPRAKDLPF